MKMMNITCNISSMAQFMQMIEAEQIRFYQIMEETTGLLPKGEPRLNTPVWPGINSSVFLTCTETQCLNLKKHIADFNRKAYNDNELIFVNSWSIDE